MLNRATEGLNEAADQQAFDRSFATVAFALDGTIRRANRNFLRLFGYDLDDIVGRHHVLFIPTNDPDREHDTAFWAVLARGECRSGTFRRVRKDGAEIWIQATYTPVMGAGGTPTEVVAFATDVTAQEWRSVDDHGQITAINTSQAVIHFQLDGTIFAANTLFLHTMGYTLEELVGQHHRKIVESSYADGDEYAQFWLALSAGCHQAGEYKRLRKDGTEVWLRATYNPIFDMNGRPFKVVEYAIDVTHEKLQQTDYEGQIAAIHKSQGVITFGMDGTVISANDRFLEAVGYRLDEIEGRHHRLFVDPSYAHGGEYATFWDDLAQGRHQAGEYKRLGKDGREVWLHATYNPVFDINGRPFKVVKYATVVTREKLRQADHQGQIASIHKAQCVISFDMDGKILDANENFLALTGYRLAQVRGRHHRMFVEQAVAESADYAAFWSDLARGRHQAAEYKRICKDGREIWLQATYNPIFDMNGRPFKVVKYATDVTEEKLRQADNDGQIAAIRKSQCVVAFALDGTILEANDNFLDAMGYRLDEIKGSHHRMFVEEDVAQSIEYIAFWKTLRSGTFLAARFKRIGKGGREVWIQASYNPILDLNGRPYKVIKIATDVTADVELAADLGRARQQAEHDAATALPNRVRLSRFMTAALTEPGARLAVLYMDLDHFKPINDTFGHHVGDRVLSETAERLRGALSADQLVARIGGDEFVVAAPDLSDEAIEALCKRLIQLVTAPIRHTKGILTVGLSIGVAVSPGDASTSDDLLRCADVALYRSKGNGRGSYTFFADHMNERIAADRHLAEDMLHGIKSGEFFLEYQPRFNAATRQVQSVEALIRWSHLARGRIEPSHFIPLAEQSGLIVQLGEWMLRTACHAALAWPGVRVFVRVSPVQFHGSDLVAMVKAVLAETGLAPERLELGMTEDVLQDEERSRTTLAALKARGVRLALDGFGTGSSSLNQLRTFPFDVITIDRRFIADIEEQEGGRAIVQSIIALGKTLGIAVKAEGDEPPLMLSLDRDSEVQGHLLAQPDSAEAMSALLAKDDGLDAAAGAASTMQSAPPGSAAIPLAVGCA